jgi:uncharacterized membrane protein
MTNTNRENIYRINQHSNVSKETVKKSLHDYVYTDKQQWYGFIKLFLLSLGIGFTTAGIVFFFAYNWADLHKFVKLGLIESLLAVSTLAVFIPAFHSTTKNIILTGAVILVGVLFAVFGQIYQTGANAYDFFMGWTAFITLWVLVSNFPPLWFIYILLINTTVYLYSEQVAYDWSEETVFSIHFCLNVLFLFATLLVKSINKEAIIPVWFTNAIALVAASCATLGIIVQVMDYSFEESVDFVLLLLTVLVYAAGVYYAMQQKILFYLALIAFSIIIILSALILRNSNESGVLLLVCLFIIASVTGLIKGLLSLHFTWTHE